MKRVIDNYMTRLRDLAFGRPRISVLNEGALSDGRDIVPIFIIGTFRSGTTLLRYILDSHSRICCPPESKFLEPLASLYASETCMKALGHMGYENLFIKKRIREFADAFFIGNMLSHNKARWADKTPEYVRILDFIEWVYGPECQYVLIYRNGLDVANSMNETKLKRLNEDKDIYKAFDYWAHDTELMLNWEKKYSDRCHALRYESLCEQPGIILHELFDFLGENWEDDVLRWYGRGHDRGDEDIKARRQRGFRFSFGNFEKWPKALRDELKKQGAGLHEAIGYDPDTLRPHQD